MKLSQLKIFLPLNLCWCKLKNLAQVRSGYSRDPGKIITCVTSKIFYF